MTINESLRDAIQDVIYCAKVERHKLRPALATLGQLLQAARTADIVTPEDARNIDRTAAKLLKRWDDNAAKKLEEWQERLRVAEKYPIESESTGDAATREVARLAVMLDETSLKIDTIAKDPKAKVWEKLAMIFRLDDSYRWKTDPELAKLLNVTKQAVNGARKRLT